jgi:hypothetical protein
MAWARIYRRKNRAPRAGLNFGFPWYGGGHIRTEEYKNETPPEGLVFPEIETAAQPPISA